MHTGETHIVEGLRTHIQVRGHGPPLLLISGLWQQIPLWDKLLPHLSGFQTIAFDPPGIGESELPRRPYSVWDLARFTTGVLDAVGVRRAHVLGLSFGGLVAQQFARSYPEHVNRLVLVSTTHGVLSLPGRPRAVAKIVAPIAYGSKRKLERNVGIIFGGKMRTQPQLAHHLHFRPPKGLKASLFRLSSTIGWTSLPWLHTLTVPTLVVHGDDDPIVPLLNARVLAHRIPGARMLLLRSGGHLVLLDSADQVAPSICGFLTKVPQR